jgi:hypothetical protein
MVEILLSRSRATRKGNPGRGRGDQPGAGIDGSAIISVDNQPSDRRKLAHGHGEYIDRTNLSNLCSSRLKYAGAAFRTSSDIGSDTIAQKQLELVRNEG